MQKHDLKDRRILYELDKNARLPFVQIARKVGLSESTVRYRVDRMMASGVLKGFLTFLDIEKVGYTFYDIYLKATFISEEEEHKVIEKLKEMKSVCWLSSITGGKYTHAVCVLAKDIRHFDRIQNEINKIITTVGEQAVFIVVDAFQMPYPLLPDQKRDLITEKHAAIGTGITMKLQPLDLQLLEILSSNARASTLELAELTQANPATVAEHVNMLIRSNLVQGFKPLINMKAFGVQWFLMLFKFRHINEKEKTTLVTRFRSIPQCFFIVNGVGNWHMQVEFYCKDYAELHQLVKQVFPGVSPVVEQVEMKIKSEHKCVFYPVGLSTNDVQMSLEVWR